MYFLFQHLPEKETFMVSMPLIFYYLSETFCLEELTFVWIVIVSSELLLLWGPLLDEMISLWVIFDHFWKLVE